MRFAGEIKNPPWLDPGFLTTSLTGTSKTTSQRTATESADR